MINVYNNIDVRLFWKLLNWTIIQGIDLACVDHITTRDLPLQIAPLTIGVVYRPAYVMETKDV